MWTVSWYRTVLEGSHGQEPPAGAARPEDTLNAEASELAPGSNGLLTLPDWLAPGHAAWRRGALLGFDGSQGRAHIYRSILEGIALTMANTPRRWNRRWGAGSRRSSCPVAARART
jgi:sugar (pentulose or hexulose) kinase